VRPIRGKRGNPDQEKLESGEYDATLARRGWACCASGWRGRSRNGWISPPSSRRRPGGDRRAVPVRGRRHADRFSGHRRVCPAPVRRTRNAVSCAHSAAAVQRPSGHSRRPRGARLHLHGRISSLDGRTSVDVENEGEDRAALVSALPPGPCAKGAAELIRAASRHREVPVPSGMPACTGSGSSSPAHGSRPTSCAGRSRPPAECRSLSR